MNEAVTDTPTRRGQRVKTPSLKALEYQQMEASMKHCDIDDDSHLDVFAESDSSASITEEESPSESSESSDGNDTKSDDDDEEFSPAAVRLERIVPHKVSSRKSVEKTAKKQRKSAKSYTIKAEDYFYHNAIKKTQTSNHTLDKLKKPRLSQEELQKLLTNLTVNEAHSDNLTELYNHNKNLFNKWMCLLHEGFNILAYGLGSKRSILHDFHKEYLSKLPVIVVNGFFPSLTMKEIIDSVIIEILEIDTVPSNLFEASQTIAEEFQRFPNLHLYLIIHNIEAEMLHVNSKHQTVLASLASINNIHLIASIDHINAPLIWDQNKLSKFNFTWWDVTTFLPYKEETSFETSLMITKTGSLALSSLRNVFLSLTSNSKGIYLIIAKYQLEHTAQYYQGMLFKDLYSACREAFLVSSDLALRAQLTEFVDHKMVRFKRSLDGAEYLIIPIPNNLLQQFLNDQ
ncbi:origin recognition complex subunit 2 [Holotrichia oblita]|uniref:Origin recognition complex subunit 2 n=1 Tax=Holotrichia oblita TaxID=644536 RepID=A0ACB9SYZ6_HOLOL|nr:origin recognition complex subunit 2 [Holotrichia oblita]